MCALPSHHHEMTEAEYLAFERASDVKHEYIAGEVFAMVGASEAHNLITGSTYAAIYVQLRGRSCKVYPSDMKVRTPGTGTYAYPDITIVCGESRLADDERDVLLNPTVIIEVLSPSTERFDRGKKFRLYREIPSLQEYILIAQDEAQVERYVRQESEIWQFSAAHGLDAEVDLTSIGCKLRLAEVYEQIDFEDAEAGE